MALTSVIRRKIAGADRGFPWSAPDWPETISRAAPERGLGAGYSTEWARRYPARLLRAILLDNVTRPMAHLIASPEVRGAEMLELVQPPVIFVPNHTSHVDTPLLLSVLPARFRHHTIVAAAADYFFDRRWKGHLWALLALIPIERLRVNRRSVDLATGLIEEGWNLVIYPEGSRSPDGWFGEFTGGAAYLAARTGSPVVPVHIDGTFRVLARDGRRLRRSPTRITFGTPMSAGTGEDARRLAKRIEKELELLAEECGSDFWSARRKAASGARMSAHGPAASPWRRSWALGPDPRERDATEPGRWAVAPARRSR